MTALSAALGMSGPYCISGAQLVGTIRWHGFLELGFVERALSSGFVEQHAVYVANELHLSWPIIRTAYRRRLPTTEIRGVWWGDLEAALAEPSVDYRTKLALVMWRSRPD